MLSLISRTQVSDHFLDKIDIQIRMDVDSIHNTIIPWTMRWLLVDQVDFGQTTFIQAFQASGTFATTQPRIWPLPSITYPLSPISLYYPVRRGGSSLSDLGCRKILYIYHWNRFQYVHLSVGKIKNSVQSFGARSPPDRIWSNVIWSVARKVSGPWFICVY